MVKDDSYTWLVSRPRGTHALISWSVLSLEKPWSTVRSTSHQEPRAGFDPTTPDTKTFGKKKENGDRNRRTC